MEIHRKIMDKSWKNRENQWKKHRNVMEKNMGKGLKAWDFMVLI